MVVCICFVSYEERIAPFALRSFVSEERGQRAKHALLCSIADRVKRADRGGYLATTTATAVKPRGTLRPCVGNGRAIQPSVSAANRPTGDLWAGLRGTCLVWARIGRCSSTSGRMHTVMRGYAVVATTSLGGASVYCRCRCCCCCWWFCFCRSLDL